jgi:hypothetical protein
VNTCERADLVKQKLELRRYLIKYSPIPRALQCELLVNSRMLIGFQAIYVCRLFVSLGRWILRKSARTNRAGGSAYLQVESYPNMPRNHVDQCRYWTVYSPSEPRTAIVLPCMQIHILGPLQIGTLLLGASKLAPVYEDVELVYSSCRASVSPTACSSTGSIVAGLQGLFRRFQ